MWKVSVVREIIGVLMSSRFYFQLTLRERHRLIKGLLSTLPDQTDICF